MSYQALDGPAKQFAISVNDTSVEEVKDGTSSLGDRAIVTIHPIDGKIWVFFGDGTSTPSATDLQTKGFPHPKGLPRSYEAGGGQPMYILSNDGTVDVRIAERA